MLRTARAKPFLRGAWAALLVAPLCAQAKEDLFLQGRYLYQKNCLVCHGKYGDGKGEMAPTLKPPPRGFTSGVFKYRSTPSGSLPTDADLARTIRVGISGTAMPSFAHLSPSEIDALVDYVKSFSSKWGKPENQKPPIEIPELPAWFKDTAELRKRAEIGRGLFLNACAPCHGSDGSGADAAVKIHPTVWGDDSVMPDLRSPGLRSGPTARDIFRTISTGLNGTAMPSFAQALTVEQRWAIAALIETFRGKAEAPR